MLLELPLTQIAAFARLHSRPRSVPRDVAETLLGDRGMRARLICDDERCCPHGINSMLDDPRPHAVRSRARRLAELAEMPHRSWRLHQVAKEAKTAASLAKRGTLVLRAEGLDTQLPATAQDALARVAEFLRHQDSDQLSAQQGSVGPRARRSTSSLTRIYAAQARLRASASTGELS